MMPFSSIKDRSVSVAGQAGLPVCPEFELSDAERCLLTHSIGAITPISRTFRGISDTSVSEEKRALKLTGPLLAETTKRNFHDAVSFLLPRIRRELGHPLDVQELFSRTADITNRELLPEGIPFLRTWAGHTGQSQVDLITEHMGAFHTEYMARHTELLKALAGGDMALADPQAIEFAAWIERQYNHKIHPQYDGCGKNSKAHAVAVLLLAGLPYPEFQDRETYIDLRGGSFEAWVASYRARINFGRALKHPTPAMTPTCDLL